MTVTASPSLRVPHRFRGPTSWANGGYLCGLIARFAARPVTVRLLKPAPLDTDLRVVDRGDVLELLHGDEPIAQARPADVPLPVPPAPPTFEQATAASRRYAGFARHPAPECFVCGPQRAEGDALRIFAGPLEAQPEAARHVVAAPWVPDPSLDAGDGAVGPEHVWAALDCPGFASAAPDMRPALLGEMTADVDRRPRIGERCVVVGWTLGSSGRKHDTGTALFGERGERLGRARAVWIEPRSG
ncbi:MAG TPA: hypothetical protein VF322_06620 [Gammaproteobacteria bacterium]